MKPPRFEYQRPETVDETLALLSEHGDDAKVLAGGQSFVPMLNMRLASPEVVVDVNRVPGLDLINAENGSIRAGALVRQRRFETADAVATTLPLVAEALPYVGHYVTRNRGTVGGSVAHADAKGELPLVLLTLGGAAVVAGKSGRRTIEANDLFVSHYTTTLEPDELLVETVWPTARPSAGSAFEEFALRRGDYAVAMAACALRIENGRAAEVRVGIAGPTDRPLLSQAGSLVVGQVVDQELLHSAAETARGEIEPIDTLHASAAYQRHLIGVLVERAVSRAWRSAQNGV